MTIAVRCKRCRNYISSEYYIEIKNDANKYPGSEPRLAVADWAYHELCVPKRAPKKWQWKLKNTIENIQMTLKEYA